MYAHKILTTQQRSVKPCSLQHNLKRLDGEKRYMKTSLWRGDGCINIALRIQYTTCVGSVTATVYATVVATVAKTHRKSYRY